MLLCMDQLLLSLTKWPCEPSWLARVHGYIDDMWGAFNMLQVLTLMTPV